MSPHLRVQLLRFGLYPATVVKPQTAATFQSLRQLRMLSLEAKISTWHYYSTLERLTDDTGLTSFPVRLFIGGFGFILNMSKL